MLKKITIASIVLYRNYLSSLKMQSCRHYPTCSAYMLEAVEKYGVRHGIFLGIKRLLRCHPFARGGYDPLVLDSQPHSK